MVVRPRHHTPVSPLERGWKSESGWSQPRGFLPVNILLWWAGLDARRLRRAQRHTEAKGVVPVSQSKVPVCHKQHVCVMVQSHLGVEGRVLRIPSCSSMCRGSYEHLIQLASKSK